jgi:NAD(P)-dependent dehydrogenase (short-subunit alcohol dehydrogenase family)
VRHLGHAAPHGRDDVDDVAGVAERFATTNPMKRMGDVHDIAESVVYVAADSGKFVTGEVVVVDGGHSAWGDTEWPGGRPDYFDVG